MVRFVGTLVPSICLVACMGLAAFADISCGRCGCVMHTSQPQSSCWNCGRPLGGPAPAPAPSRPINIESGRIDGLALYLKAGTVLDAQSKPFYEVAVVVADASLPGSPTATATYTLMTEIVTAAGETVTDSVVHLGGYELVKLGTGTLVLDKANIHTGGVTVEAGTIALRNGAAFGTGIVRVKAGAAIVIDPAAGHVIGSRLVVEPGGRVDIGTGYLGLLDILDVASILATGLFNSGPYQSEAVASTASLPLADALAAEATGTSAAVTASPFELAFAAMATGDQTTTTAKKGYSLHSVECFLSQYQVSMR